MFETVGRRRDADAPWRYLMASCGTLVVLQTILIGFVAVFLSRWLWTLFWLFMASLLHRPELELVALEEPPEIEEVQKIELDLGTPVEVADRAQRQRVVEAPIVRRVGGEHADPARYELLKQLGGLLRIREIDVDDLLRHRRLHGDHAQIDHEVGVLKRRTAGRQRDARE